MNFPDMENGGDARKTVADALSAAVLIGAIVFIYRGAFSGFFVQDDFGWLTASRFRSFGEYIHCFFRFNPALGYRPLSQETFFWAGQTLFGMSPAGFHAMSVLFHVLGSLAVYVLLRQFFAPLPCLAGALFYGVHDAHSRSVYWISAVPEPMAAACYVVALILFVRFDRTGDRRLYGFSVLAAVLGIMCKESILTLPLVLLAYCAIFSRGRLGWAAPFFALPALYFSFRLAGVADVSPYPLTFGKEALANLCAYFSWAAACNVGLLVQKLQVRADENYPWIAAAFVIAVAGLIWLGKNRRISMFAVIWFALALQPVLYFSGHIFPYYLAPALPAVSLLIASALSRTARLSKAGAFAGFAAVAWFSLWTAEASVRREGRWWNDRSLVSRNILQQMPEVNSQVPPGRIAFLFGFGEWEFGAMMGDAAFKAYGFSPDRFILVGLNPATPIHIESIKATGHLGDYYCFRYSEGKLKNMTSEFRADPIRFLPPRPKPPPARFIKGSNVAVSTNSKEIQAGKDTLVLRVYNLDAAAVDLMYTLDGREMPILAKWRLDKNHSAAVFVDKTTAKGMYHLTGIRDSTSKDADSWFAIDEQILVK